MTAAARAARRPSDVPRPIAAYQRDLGVSSSVGSLVLVGGRLWGVLAVHRTRPEPFPPDIYISQPALVADVISQAAGSVRGTT
jgi:light-regulated signal transduction histidine kinase (bacteriophytochrome)